MYCSKCGHENPDEAKHCAACGALLTGVVPLRDQLGDTPPPEPETQVPYAAPGEGLSPPRPRGPRLEVELDTPPRAERLRDIHGTPRRRRRLRWLLPVLLLIMAMMRCQSGYQRPPDRDAPPTIPDMPHLDSHIFLDESDDAASARLTGVNQLIYFRLRNYLAATPMQRRRIEAGLDEVFDGWPQSQGAAAAVPLFIEALGGQGQERRLAAAEGLGRFGGKRAIEPLLAALKAEEEPEVLQAIGSALVRIGGERVTAGLRQLARDADPQLRSRAEELLAKLDRTTASRPAGG
jgi:hypothetical protein